MSREIKFRAWDKKLAKYVEPAHMLIDGNGKLFSWGDHKLDSARFVVEFYTGLKDKNGVEIYEGDVVVAMPGAPPDEIIITSGCFCLKNAIQHYEATYWTDEIEVIGSVYENPDLLGARKVVA